MLICTLFQLNRQGLVPDEVPTDAAEDEDFLAKAHHALFEVRDILWCTPFNLTQATLQIDVKEGELECPESHKVFPIHNGVANMLLNEDETEAS